MNVACPAPGETAVILFAHGARNAEWAVPFQRMCDAMRARAPARTVRLAFLELMQPSLPDTLTELVAGGVRRIAIVPCFMAPGGHLRNDLPRLVAAFSAAHPGLRIDVTPAIGELDCLIHAVADFALATADRMDVPQAPA